MVQELDRTMAEVPAKGQWRRIILDGKPNAEICCPECGYVALLDHEIDDQGRVTPSVECPMVARGACTFHRSGLLLRGWLA